MPDRATEIWLKRLSEAVLRISGDPCGHGLRASEEGEAAGDLTTRHTRIAVRATLLNGLGPVVDRLARLTDCSAEGVLEALCAAKGKKYPKALAEAAYVAMTECAECGKQIDPARAEVCLTVHCPTCKERLERDSKRTPAKWIVPGH